MLICGSICGRLVSKSGDNGVESGVTLLLPGRLAPQGCLASRFRTLLHFHHHHHHPRTQPTALHAMSSTATPSPTSATSLTPRVALRPSMNIADDDTFRVRMPGDNEFVKLCHPGYAFGSSVMLQLRPVDSLANAPSTTTTITDLPEATAALSLYGTGNTRFGLHYNTAATACYIIAANRPGVLISQRFTQSQFAAHVQSHPECLTPDLDQLLTKHRYWFYPLHWDKDPEPRYPVCPDFRSWAFPHERFPTLEPWNHSTAANVPLENGVRERNVAPSAASASVKIRDKRCKISDYADALKCAHLVPWEESLWVCRSPSNSWLLHC